MEGGGVFGCLLLVLCGWLRGEIWVFVVVVGRFLYDVCVGYMLVVFYVSGCFMSLCSCTVARGCVVGVGVGWLCVWGMFVDCGAFLGVFVAVCVMGGYGIWDMGLWIYMRENAEICINICMYMHDFIIFAVVS